MNRQYLYQMVLKMVFTNGGEIIFSIKLWLLKHEKKLLECRLAQFEKSFTRLRTGKKYFFEGGLALVFYNLLVEETDCRITFVFRVISPSLYNLHWHMHFRPVEVYSEACQTSKLELFSEKCKD